MNHVIGGSGFIGSHLVKKLGARALDFDLRGDPVGKLEVIAPQSLVFHAAHVGSLDECAKDRAHTREVNVTGTIRFFNEVKKLGGIPVYFSSNMVFSGEKHFYGESEVPNPITEYGRQKLEIEQYLAANFEQYVILRLTKVYGPGSGSFIDEWGKQLKEGKEVTAVSDMYAAPVHIDDVLRAIESVLSLIPQRGICHISGPRELSLEEIARCIATKVDARQILVRGVSMDDMDWQEKRGIHNSLACDTLRRPGGFLPRSIEDIL